ncbi:MAG TPA: Spy/CpxP family protein refolding chaperone [Spirochaetota bacterium]|jgi:Spy/CpxP family protein refolding chaperone|nr:Spy/CpxP family protein refolding chaperone [Spirochaetota bacterium]OPZ35954.1 MAG: periplasmic repressor CpxP [Spirochaetes bacterium ADurb.BinA120]HNU91792.1 Spy/CpxP family protein refolding chaperone [Spirochaetota bacterium]HPI14037.1 Spy/CpxP family protein refolding chaperone [Spirochaetota bacterium]HPO46545.1 Spy/CpxP family protein refolding chaperone [Spirochaetota bacterium]
MKKGKMLTVMALALVLAGGQALYAQRGNRPARDGDMPHRGMHGDGAMVDGCGPFYGDPARMKASLGLSDDQVNKIAAINQEYKKKFLDYREKMAPKHIQLRKLLLEDNVDINAARKLIKELSDIQVETTVLRIQHSLDIEKLLTKEQKARLRTEKRGMRTECPYKGGIR